jgi:amino acid permease
MMKALVLCYSVIVFTFFLSSITGYWAFGSHVQSNVLKSLMPDSGPALAPTWLLGVAVLFVLLQLLAIGLVYSQVAYEIMEKNSADVAQGRFSRRNLIPRLLFRTLYLAFCAFIAAMLPFFGDIVGVVGAVGFIPLDFVLPVLMYNMALAPPRRSSSSTRPSWSCSSASGALAPSPPSGSSCWTPASSSSSATMLSTEH